MIDDLSQSQAEAMIKLTVDQMHEGIQIVDRSWRYVYLNGAAARHGRNSIPKLLGRTMQECFPGIESSEMFKLLRAAMEKGEPARMENLFDYGGGETCWFALYFEPHERGVLIRSIDISDAKKLEQQYLHAQKMEAIGRLAGGIAHDFNNKLGIIQIYTDMAMRETSASGSPALDNLKRVLNAVEGATHLTRQLLAFSRKQVFDVKVVNLNDVTSNLGFGLIKLLGEGIRLQIDLDPELGNAWVDPSQFDQVIMNLVLNARDAMPTGGVLTIETANVELDSSFCATRSEMKPGSYVMLSVSDTGTGIPADIKDKIFEPFFTTKNIGKGTGLGLSSVFGIVKQSRGQIWVYSEVGIGTTFKIYLPRVDQLKDQVDYQSEPEEDVRGTETVLLVEDDEALRTAYARTLETAGYAVHAAGDVKSAKSLFMQLKGAVHLLLTDVVLESSSGRALARELGAVNGELKVAFMSGYTENSIVHHGVLDEGAILIQKPISMRKLLGTVRKVLDGRLKTGVV